MECGGHCLYYRDEQMQFVLAQGNKQLAPLLPSTGQSLPTNYQNSIAQVLPRGQRQ
jgi:hypothetical protein